MYSIFTFLHWFDLLSLSIVLNIIVIIIAENFREYQMSNHCLDAKKDC